MILHLNPELCDQMIVRSRRTFAIFSLGDEDPETSGRPYAPIKWAIPTIEAAMDYAEREFPDSHTFVDRSLLG